MTLCLLGKKKSPMKKVISIFILLTVLFSGCKRESTPAKGALAENEQAIAKTEKSPYITNIVSRYILIDSSAIQINLKVSAENLKGEEGSKVAEFEEYFRLNWNLVTDEGIRERIKAGKVELTNENVAFEDNNFFITFEVPRTNLYAKGILILEFLDTKAARKFTNDIAIDFTGQRLNTRFGIYYGNSKRPGFSNYVALGETIRAEAIKPASRPLYLLHFSPDFGPARSPMSTKPSFENLAIEYDTLRKVATSEQISFQEEGLYVLTEDSANIQKGTTFCVVDERYPRFTYPAELVQPLIYMSTNVETEAIKQSTDAKQAFDIYFLQLAQGNHTVAKQMIRSYFRRVTEANRLFTNYKEGWKTDRGMVYIIMGPPSRIQRLREREVWLYAQTTNTTEVIFTFYKKPNQFTDENYELVRYPDYSQYWYPYVEAWRNGRIIE